MSKNSIFDDQFFSSLGGKSKPEQSTKKGDSLFSDLVASFGEGAGGLVEGVGTFLGGSDSTVARIGKDAVDYWGERKSESLKAQQQELGTMMEDENAGMLNVAGHVVTSPRLMASLLAGSAPSMALGMGAGGLVARGMTAGKIMTTAAGGLTRTGSALAAGIGEGMVLMPEVYSATKGDLATGTAGAMALGVVTNLVTPGNISAQMARRVSGEGAERAAAGLLNRTVAGRVVGSGLAEAGQEFIQEGGQAVLEQVGRDEDINLLAAAKQGTVGAIMGGTMGVGLHPLVGEGAPTTNPSEEPAPEDIGRALESDPNNPVLLAEQAVVDARAVLAANPSPPNEMQLRVAEARLAEARNPNSREASDSADHIAAQAIRDTVGDDGVRAAIDVAVEAADGALRAAPDVETAIAAFAAREQASSVGLTAAAMVKAEQGVADAVAMNIETYDAELAEADLRATEQEDRRAAQQVSAATAEEINVAEPGGQAFPEIEATTREEVFAAFQPRIVEQEVRVLDASLPQQVREEAKRKMYALQAERDAIAASLPAAAVGQITYVAPGEPALEDQLEQIESSPGYTVRRNEAETASRGAPAYDVVGPNGDVFDTYAGPAAEQDAAATAERLNARDNTAAALPPEVIAHRDELVAAGFLDSVAQSIEQEDTDTLRARANNLSDNLRVTREHAFKVLDSRGEAPMTWAQFRTREDAFARAMDELIAERPGANERVVRGNLARANERELRRVAQDYSSPLGRLATVELAMRQGAHMGNVDTAMPRATTNSVAGELRQAAAEVEAEAEADGLELEGTTPGRRDVETNFERRARAMLDDGTLGKLGRFWSNLMSKPGQRTLPPVNTEDLVAETRERVRNGGGIPQRVLDELAARYNSAMKDAAKEWAEAHNQTFDELAWVDPIVPSSVRAQGAGTSAGFSIQIYGVGRSGANPYVVRPNSRPANFSADSSIHAVSISSAPGSADLAYRFAANVAHLRGRPFYADSILSTVNNLRRQLQSMSADTLFGPGTINPLQGQRTSGSYQGMSVALWRDARTKDNRIGLNALRANHSILENRALSGYIVSSGNIFENLTYNSRGQLIASSDPRHAGGFQRGTVVTDEMLQAAVGRANPETGIRPFERDQGSGGVGAATVRLAAINNTVLKHLEENPNGRIPAWISRVAQAEGRKLDGWFFSEAPTDAAIESAPLDRASATERIGGLVGEKAAKVLLDGGVISFVDTAAELVGDSFSVAGKIQGATDASGRITLVLENLTNDNFDAVLSHEALHSTLENLVGKETYAKLMAKLDTLLKAGSGSNWAKDAERRVPKSTPAEHRLDEVAAYAVELASDNDADTSNPLVRWGREFMSALRAAMIKSSIVPEALKVWAIENLQANDLRHLAIAGLRAKASGAGAGTRQSMGRNYQEEIESLLAEHMMPETTGPRRAEINTEIAKLRTAQRVEQDAAFESSRTSEATYGTPVENAVSVRAVHYSGAQRSTLSSAAYGTGLKGEEAGRLSGAENNDIRPRIHFYVDEGSGITPEAGVGSFAHAVTLNNLYDLKADPLKLRQADSNAMERAIVAAGFDGYYAPDYRGAGQGAAVLIGEHNVPVKPYVEGGSVNPAPSKSPQQIYTENLRNSKLPAGNMTGREWLVAIKGSEFATPNVLSALESRQDERFYRDDLPRLNELRFSIAEEVKICTEPVAPPSPVELNIMQNALRKPFQRALEKFRAVIQDKNVTLRRVQQLAGVTAENTRMDTIGALDRLGSRLMVQQQELVMEPLARIENILSRSGFSEDAGRAALDQALIDFHVEEYNDHIATINPARYKMENGKRVYVSGFDAEHPGSGIKTADAKARIINLLKAAERGDKQALAVLEARGVYRDMIRNLQAFAVERGLEKQETIDSWNEKFPNYTPFNRDLDLDEDLSIGTVPGSQGFSLRTGIARRAMGSAAEIVSPLVSTTLFGLKTTTRGENAVVSRTMLNFARAFVPNYFTNGEWKPMWRVDTVPTQRVLKKVNVYRTKMANGEMSPEFYNRDQARDYADYQQSLWVAANPDADQNTSGIGVQRIGNEPQNRVIVQKIPNPLGDEFTMVIPEDGENRVIVFDKHSHDAVAIMNALKGKATSGPNAATLNKLLSIPRMFSRWVMATSTGFNPVFSIFNAARDIQGAMISIGSDQIPGWTTADSLAVGRNFFPAANSIWRHRGAVFRALHSNGLKPRPEPGSYAEWADEAARYGGVTGVRQSIADIDDAETQIRRLFGQREITRTNSSREASDWLSSLNGAVIKLGDSFARFGDGETKAMGLGWISRNVVSATARLNEAAELATRTAVFKAATEKFMADGKTEEEAKTLAANISKNVSTNFNRRGNMSGMINQLYPFFNAATQGSARIAEVIFQKESYKVEFGGRVVVDQRTKLTPYGKVVLSALAGLGGLQAALLAMAGFDDEEPPSYIKERAFVIPLGTGGNYIAIPMPHGFNTIVNFGRDMADAIIHRENAAQHVASAIWQAPAFNPFGSAGNQATDFTPAIVDGPLSLYMNMDPFGRPIAKQDPDPANPTPGFTRAREGASGFARAVAEGLNLISGGNEDQKGFVSPTPDQIDFALGIVGGGVGRELGKATSLATNTATRMAGGEVESIPTHKLPLIGRLYGNVNDPTAMRSKLFNMRQELNEKYARYKGLSERGDVEAAEAFWDENPELALRADIERFVRQDAKQRKQRALARGEGEIGEVNRITDEQNALAAELVTEYRNLTSRD